ncbi:hypothetical protein [Nocardia sp. NPDC060259]|uniref:hypothetical protein n=1 Tax=Nocardia sp. NPDC060259 TaxID=3347088 RepID=UPI003656DF75
MPMTEDPLAATRAAPPSTCTDCHTAGSACVADHRAVDQDQIKSRAAELAKALGVRAPQVKSGTLPRWWFPDGVWIRALVWNPVIVIGAAFDDLSASERDGVLAAAAVRAEMLRKAMFKYVIVFAIAIVPILALELAFFELGVSFAPAMTLVFTLFPALYLTSVILWSRRLVFRSDARLADVMGREFVEPLLDLDRRVRYRRRGVIGMVFDLACPAETRRAEAISYADSSRPAQADHNIAKADN